MTSLSVYFGSMTAFSMSLRDVLSSLHDISASQYDILSSLYAILLSQYDVLASLYQLFVLVLLLRACQLPFIRSKTHPARAKKEVEKAYCRPGILNHCAAKTNYDTVKTNYDTAKRNNDPLTTKLHTSTAK